MVSKVIIYIIGLVFLIPFSYALYWSGGNPAVSEASTFNITYATYAYNQTLPAITYLTNLYGMFWYNQTYTYYSDQNWIIQNSTKGFNFNESKLATSYFNASTVNPVRGTAVGNLGDIQTYNNIPYNVTEVSGAIGLDLRVNFTGITTFNQLVFRYKSIASESHQMYVQIYDYTNNDWQNYATLLDVPDYNVKEIGIYDPSDHVSGGIVRVRFYSPENGNTNHIHYFDWVTIANGFATPSGAEVDPKSIHTNAINESQFYYNGQLQLNESFVGLVNNESYLTTFNTTYNDYAINKVTRSGDTMTGDLALADSKLKSGNTSSYMRYDTTTGTIIFVYKQI